MAPVLNKNKTVRIRARKVEGKSSKIDSSSRQKAHDAEATATAIEESLIGSFATRADLQAVNAKIDLLGEALDALNEDLCCLAHGLDVLEDRSVVRKVWRKVKRFLNRKVW